MAYIYFKQDGSIACTFTGTLGQAAMQAEHDEYPFLYADTPATSDTHWVVSGSLTAKQPMPFITTNAPLIANGTAEVIISGIPAGVQVQWPDGQTDIVTDGEIRFSVDLAGTYAFRFTAVQYLDKEITVEAIPAT